MNRIAAGWAVTTVLGGALLALDAAPAAGVGRWVAPLQPVAVRRAFDPPARDWQAGHRGVDLAAQAGVSVRVAGSGRVHFAGTLAGRGVVSVDHGALRTTYEPLVVQVHTGESVVRGQVIGRLSAGHAGPRRAGEALLHWGLRRGERYLDPLSLLRRPSRLVSWWSADARVEARVDAHADPAGASDSTVSPPSPSPSPSPTGRRDASRDRGESGDSRAGLGVVALVSAGAALAVSGGRARRSRPP